MTIRDSDISLSVVIISEVMTESSIAMNLDRAGNIFRVWGILRGAKIRHLPLRDERRNLLGTITSESIRQILKPADFLQMRRETRNYDHTSNRLPQQVHQFEKSQNRWQQGAKAA